MISTRATLFLPVTVALMVGVFVLDLVTPLGIAVWVLYVVPIMVTYWSAGPRRVRLTTLCATVLIFIASFLAPPGIAIALAILNRCIGALMLWFTTVVLVKQHLMTELQRERDLSNLILNSLPGIYFLHDERGRLLRWNYRLEQVSGFSAAEIAQFHPLDFFAGEEKVLLAERIATVFSTGQAEVEADFIDRYGLRTPYQFIGIRAPIEGQPCLLGIGIDVSARKRAEATSARLAAIVDFSDDAIISKDLSGAVISWNKGAERLFGYTAAEMVGSSILRLIPADRQGKDDHILGKIDHGEDLNHVQTQQQTKDGRLIDISITASPIRDSFGKIVGASHIARDITVRKQYERELARLTRLYAALSQINQAIVRMPTRDELFPSVCQILVEHAGFHLAWIGWRDLETNQLVPMGVWGDEDGFIARIKIYTDDRPEGRGPSGLAFRSGRRYICNDILNDPVTLPWRPELLRRGLKASAAFPIRLQNEVRGMLTVHSEEPFYFQDKEIALLEEAADDVSFALNNLALEEAQRKAEESVRHERDFSKAVLNSLPGVFYLYDQGGSFLRWNENFERVTGYVATEVAAMHPLQFFAEAERELVAAKINEVFEKGEADLEAGFVSRDGRVTPYYFTGVMTQLAGQKCLVGVGIDISKRQQAEDLVRASEGRYRTLFEYAPDGIVIADPTSSYIDANASICQMLGYTRDELIGLHALDIVDKTEAHQIEPALNAINGKADHHREWQFRRKNGTTFPAEVVATLMPDGNLMGMIRDVTERKEAEVEREKRLQAEAADRIKSAFLATMSHELRTPLNSIIGFTGIILQGLAGPLNPEQSKQLDMVRTSARHLLRLVNDVLDISKIEAGQLEVASEPFDLNQSLAKVIALVTPLAEKKGLALHVNLAPDLSQAVNDERRFEQILLNLLSNAIKFTDRGEIALTAELIDDSSTPPAPSGRAAVLLRVSDTGIGIKQEDLTTLFQPFRQIDSGLSRNHDGTGLGLAICRRLADLMGGKITAQSIWGKGSTFSFRLPLKGSPRP